jgi:carboxypeptidase C (cathepsin A)
MEMGYTGPRLVNVDDEGYPVQPYGIKENPYSLVDMADIVYVDPVNTGYSRITGNAAPSKFFGVNADIKYLAEWLSTFVTRYSRWTSPKYLNWRKLWHQSCIGSCIRIAKPSMDVFKWCCTGIANDLRC